MVRAVVVPEGAGVGEAPRRPRPRATSGRRPRELASPRRPLRSWIERRCRPPRRGRLECGLWGSWNGRVRVRGSGEVERGNPGEAESRSPHFPEKRERR